MPASGRGHIYLKTHRLSGTLMSFRPRVEAERLRAQAAASRAGRAAKTLVKDGPLRITQVALRKGVTLQTHRVEGPVSVQVLRGRCAVTTDSGEIAAVAGDLIAIDAGVAHAVRAVTDLDLLITAAVCA
ncbi:MAG TPA: cupin domain-containing protein [Dehalococcoidia bacterium]|nr:cupin domain-containing protein [Dehalococcoidia bacterium]